MDQTEGFPYYYQFEIKDSTGNTAETPIYKCWSQEEAYERVEKAAAGREFELIDAEPAI